MIIIIKINFYFIKNYYLNLTLPQTLICSGRCELIFSTISSSSIINLPEMTCPMACTPLSVRAALTKLIYYFIINKQIRVVVVYYMFIKSSLIYKLIVK